MWAAGPVNLAPVACLQQWSTQTEQKARSERLAVVCATSLHPGVYDREHCRTDTPRLIYESFRRNVLTHRHSIFLAGFSIFFWSLCLDSLQKFVEDVHLRARDRYHTSSSVSISLSHAPSASRRPPLSTMCVLVVPSLEISSLILAHTLRSSSILEKRSEPSRLGLQRDAAGWY